MKNFKRYVGIFRGVRIPWVMLILLLGLEIIDSYVFLEQATLTADIIDASQMAIDLDQLIRFVAVLVISALLSIASSYIGGWVDEKINSGVRTKLWNKLMHLPARCYDVENGDTLVSRVTTDTEYSNYYFSLAITTSTALYQAVVAFIRMYSYSAKLTWYILTIIPILLLGAWGYGKLNLVAQRKYQGTFAAALGYLVERTRNLRLIKAARTEYAEQEQGKKLFHRQFQVGYITSISSSFSVLLIEALACLNIIIVFVVGGQLVQAGEITTGKLIGCYTLSSLLAVRLMQPMLLYGQMKAANGRLQRVAELLDTPDEVTDGVELDVGDEDLVLDHVNFSYEDIPVLKELTCRIPRGKVTAVIGANGAGKSTLFKLLERMYDPSSGSIAFGDTDVRNFDLTSWRQSFAIVSQDKPLLSGTVRSNILYGVRRKVSEEELVQVAKRAGIYDFVMATPGGFDAPVSVGGINFSGGQRQCIAIARAMMRNPDYLLLDEATSDLDAKSEQLVSHALSELMKGRTTVMIAHSYAATRDADYVIVLENGSVAAAGTPEELLSSSAFYRDFVSKGGHSQSPAKECNV